MESKLKPDKRPKDPENKEGSSTWAPRCGAAARGLDNGSAEKASDSAATFWWPYHNTGSHALVKLGLLIQLKSRAKRNEAGIYINLYMDTVPEKSTCIMK